MVKSIYRVIIVSLLLITAPTVALFNNSAHPRLGPRSSFQGLSLRLQLNAAGVPVMVLWDYDFTQPTNKPCTATLSINCVTGFNVWTTDATGVMLGTSSVVTPTAVSTTGVTAGILIPYVPPTMNLGVYVINVQTAYRDAAGALQGGMSSGITWTIPSGPFNVRLQ